MTDQSIQSGNPMLKIGTFAVALVVLSGCAGKLDYIRPESPSQPTSNTKVVERSRDAVWNEVVPALGKQFFVINNLDKSSGLINISYNGDPLKYIDCGRIVSFVKNARGERTYDFPAASASQEYEVMNGSGLFQLQRTMSLEGRVNLIFEEVSTNATRITASTRYVVQRQQTVRDASGRSNSKSDVVNFNSGSGASFPEGAFCQSNGSLERELLLIVK